MARKSSRRTFGAVRRLPSGRWQAHYTIEETGERRLAPITFATKDEADGWLSTVRADMLRGNWRDPLIGDFTLAVYFPKWLAARPKLKPRTVALYERLAAHWLIPAVGSGDSTVELGVTPLRRITTKTVREWMLAAPRDVVTLNALADRMADLGEHEICAMLRAAVRALCAAFYSVLIICLDVPGISDASDVSSERSTEPASTRTPQGVCRVRAVLTATPPSRARLALAA